MRADYSNRFLKLSVPVAIKNRLLLPLNVISTSHTSRYPAIIEKKRQKITGERSKKIEELVVVVVVEGGATSFYPIHIYISK